MTPSRRTHVAASVAYAALAATMAGVLLSSGHPHPATGLSSLHLSSDPASPRPSDAPAASPSTAAASSAEPAAGVSADPTS